MIVFRYIILGLFIAGLSGCTSAAERQAEVEADLAEEKLLLMKDYRQCLKEHAGEENAQEACEHLHKAAETFNK